MRSLNNACMTIAIKWTVPEDVCSMTVARIDWANTRAPIVPLREKNITPYLPHKAEKHSNLSAVFTNTRIVPFDIHTPTFSTLLNERQRQRAHNAQPNNSPPSLLHLLVVNHARGIPNQMPQPIERVVSERQRQRDLSHHLERQRPRSEAGSEHRTLEVPADSRRD
jgi:hypothetical protein